MGPAGDCPQVHGQSTKDAVVVLLVLEQSVEQAGDNWIGGFPREVAIDSDRVHLRDLMRLNRADQVGEGVLARLTGPRLDAS